jgi:hypothetical protein
MPLSMFIALDPSSSSAQLCEQNAIGVRGIPPWPETQGSVNQKLIGALDSNLKSQGLRRSRSARERSSRAARLQAIETRAELPNAAGSLARPPGSAEPSLKSAAPARSRKRWAALVGVAAFLVGISCRRDDDQASAAKPQVAFSRGDYVVVEPEAARFFEARVLAVEGSRLRVQRVEAGDTATVATADVYRLPPPSQRYTAGGLAICRAREKRWVGCRIESAAPDKIIGRDAEGERVEVEVAHVLPPNPVTELNLRRHFERADRRSDFQRAIARAGSPRAPSGWRPLPRDRVVVRDETGWYSAVVHEVEEDGIHVAWKADQRVEEVAKGSIVPETPQSQVLRSGQAALLRPDGPAQPWRPVRIESARTGALTVIDVNGQRRGATPRDLLLLVSPDAE